jgi:hypothetical protein
MRLLIGLGGHPAAERPQFLVGFGGELLQRFCATLCADGLDERRLELTQAVQQDLTGVAAFCPRTGRV